MKNFKFKFSYVSPGCRMKGDGTCKAEDIDGAFEVAKNGVAGDLKADPANVNIQSMREYKPRKKKAVSNES